MKLIFSGIGVLFLLFSAAAKPGEPYKLTGREKSIFGIFQADMKAFPELYDGEDINAYYTAFKELNNLDDRKLKLGEELMFPHTAKSEELHAAELEKAAAEKAEAKAAARAEAKRARAEKAAKRRAEAVANGEAVEPMEYDEFEDDGGNVTLFGSDRPSSRVYSPEEKAARAEAERARARRQAVYQFQHAYVPYWLLNNDESLLDQILKGNVKSLAERAREQVDDRFANAIKLHGDAKKQIHVVEFEQPEKGGDFFFVAVQETAAGRLRFFALELGISIFGVGDESVLFEWKSDGELVELGGRDYTELTRFVQEIEIGPVKRSDDEE